jgi:hypothetical protein
VLLLKLPDAVLLLEYSAAGPPSSSINMLTPFYIEKTIKLAVPVPVTEVLFDICGTT